MLFQWKIVEMVKKFNFLNFLVAHIEPPPTIPISTCQAISCSFDLDECLNQVTFFKNQDVFKVRDTGWRVHEGQVGNMHTGIRMGYSGSFVYVKGENFKKIEFFRHYPKNPIPRTF